MHQIIWATRAENDYYETLIYWTKRNKSNSFSNKLIAEVDKKLIAEVDKKLKVILQNPKSGLATNIQGTHKINFLKYFSIYYQVSEKYIEIVSFWDNRRNPEKLEI